MKNKITKIIIFTIFLILVSLFLANNVEAAFKLENNGPVYYTRDDVHWRNSHIVVDGIGDFYCINHNHHMVKYLSVSDGTFTKEITSGR